MLRPRSISLIALVVLASLTSPARGQAPCDPQWSEGLFGVRGLDGTVLALVVHDDGSGSKLYAGGSFTVAGEAVASNVARWTGSAWEAFGDPLDGLVNALAVHDDGGGAKLYAGGAFLNAGGTTVNRVACWDGSAWSALGAGVGGEVRALASFDDGGGAELFVGGDFTTAGGAGANRIASWNGSAWTALGSGTGDAVHALAVWNDGGGDDLYVGGPFTTAGGASANRIARWSGSAWSALGTGAGAIVRAIAVHDDGGGSDLYLAGDFTTAGGGAANRVARWDGSVFSALGTGANNVGRSLHSFSGNLYLGGTFTTAGGTTVNRIARWDGSAFSALGTGTSAAVQAIADFGGELVAGGAFLAAGSASVSRIASWDGSAWAALGEGLDDSVLALAAHDDGGGEALFVGGNFLNAGAVSASRVAKWDGSAFSALGAGVGGRVNALASFGGDLYVAGNFTTAGGAGANRIARWDGSAWAALGSGLGGEVHAIAVFDDGSGDALFAGGIFSTAGGSPANNVAKWNGSGWSALGSGTNGRVRALAVYDDGGGDRLYAAGEFTTAGGGAANRVASWNGSAWSALGSGTDAAVYALGVKTAGPATGLYASGAFANAGGSAAAFIARWNGSAWSGVGAGTNASTRALAVFDDGAGEAIYAGGDFTTAGGLSANRIARWDGTAWSALSTGLNGSVEAIARRGSGSSGQLFAGGLFRIAGGVASNNLARWSPGSLPEITSQPASATACVGDMVTLTVAATGVPALAYQWRKGGVDIGGETGTSLVIDPVALADAGVYDVVVTDGNGCSVTSSAATLDVPEAPAVTADPTSRTVCAGDSTTFMVSATGGAPLSYQWRKGGVDIGGATASSYTIDPVTAGDAGSYDVVVSNACGSDTSAAATLAVELAPSIDAEPSSQTVCVGGAAGFTVAASGTAPLSYQWRKGGVDISGETGASLAIDPAALADAGSYDVVVTNGCGSATSAAATLTVEEPPSISTNPVGATVCEGDPLTFTVAATGTAPLAYQWRKNAAPIGGANGTSLTIDPVATSDAGAYDVVVTNGCGMATSAAATLVVEEPPSIVTQPAPATECEGGAVTFTASATGTAPLAYQWRKDTLPIGGANSSSYTIDPVAPADEGSYDVVVTNGCGSATSDAAILDIVDRELVSLSLAPAFVDGGDASTGTVTLSCAAPPGGTVVLLSSADPLTVAVPVSVTVLEDETEATFSATTVAVGATTDVLLTASLDAVMLDAPLRVLPPGIECLSGPGAVAAYYHDTVNDVGELYLSNGGTWTVDLLDVDVSLLTGNRQCSLLVQDHGAGSGGETLATVVIPDFGGAGAHRLESDDLGAVVRSRHDFMAGEVTGPFDLRVEFVQICAGMWDVIPSYRLPGDAWTVFADGPWTTASAFDLTQARIAVAIDAAAGGTLCYRAPIPAHESCARGNVNGGAGPVADVLFVNGSSGDPLQRTMTIGQFDPFQIFVDRPPSKGGVGQSRYALYVWVGRPRPCTMRTNPMSIGVTCMPTPLTGMAAPRPKHVWNNIGKTNFLGVPTLPSSPAPTVVLNRPGGLRKELTLFFQGFIIDTAGPNGSAAVTNGVTVISE